MIDLFQLRLDEPPEPIEHLRRLLSSDERARADRFRFERHRRRFTVGRAVLRTILARYVGLAPESLSFTYNEQGKPALPEGPSFNLSHSGEWLFLGVTESGRLGVDVEEIREMNDLHALAERNFAPDEIRELKGREEREVHRAFFRTWTRKESFLKALGGGLSIPLRSFSVSLDARAENSLLRVDDPEEEIEHWCVRSIAGFTEAEAALAIDRREVEIRHSGGFGGSIP